MEWTVALVVLLVDGNDGAVSVGPDAADRLARLGVTNVAVVRDGDTTGLVLDGWLFDIASAPDAARAIVGLDRPVRVLLPLIQMAVSAGIEGATDVSQATHEPRAGSGRHGSADAGRRRVGPSAHRRP
jgi:hypothetical protein